MSDAPSTHDWRHRLVRVVQGEVTMRLVIDPLGNEADTVKEAPAGETDLVKQFGLERYRP